MTFCSKLHNAAEVGDKEAVLAFIQEQRQKLEAWVCFSARAMVASAVHNSMCLTLWFLLLVQASTIPPHQPAAADPPAFVRMQLDTFVNTSEVDGLTPFHLAMINGTFPSPAGISGSTGTHARTSLPPANANAPQLDPFASMAMAVADNPCNCVRHRSQWGCYANVHLRTPLLLDRCTAHHFVPYSLNTSFCGTLLRVNACSSKAPMDWSSQALLFCV